MTTAATAYRCRERKRGVERPLRRANQGSKTSPPLAILITTLTVSWYSSRKFEHGVADLCPLRRGSLVLQYAPSNTPRSYDRSSGLLYSLPFMAETINLLSQCLTIDPGDVAVMATPAGVGFARWPLVSSYPTERAPPEVVRGRAIVRPCRAYCT